MDTDISGLLKVVAEHGSINKAADALGIPRTTLKRWLRNDAVPTKRQGEAIPTNIGERWQRFSNDAQVEAIRERYLAVTSRREYALDVPVTLTSAEYYNCVDSGDVHLGPPECAYDRWLALLGWIREQPDTGLIINGDLLNVATKTAPGLGPAADVLPHSEAWNLALADLEPLARAGKLHAILRGNHEARIANVTGVLDDPLYYLARELGVPYCGYEVYIRWFVEWQGQTHIYIGYHNHGSSNAATSGAVHNALERLAHRNRGDYCVMAHTHRRFAENLTWREVDRQTGEILTCSAPMVASGSFQRLMGGTYSADRGLQPADIGAASIYLYGSRQAVHTRT